MTLNGAEMGRLLQQSLLDPAGAARVVLAGRPAGQPLWLALLLVTCLGVLIAAAVDGPSIVIPIGPENELVIPPFAYAAILGASLLVTVIGLYWTGRALGGTGSFADALAVVVWLEVVAIAVRIVQIVILLIVPPLATIASILGLGILLWCLVNFVKELHGFRSLGRSVLTLILAAIGIFVGLSMILALIGIGATAGGA